MDSHKKTILKAISWRAIATLVLAVTVYLFTENPMLSMGIAAADITVKFLLYYLHERIWLQIHV